MSLVMLMRHFLTHPKDGAWGLVAKRTKHVTRRLNILVLLPDSRERSKPNLLPMANDLMIHAYEMKPL